MIAILHHVTSESEEGIEEGVVKAANGIEEDIKEFLRCGLRIVVRNGY